MLPKLGGVGKCRHAGSNLLFASGWHRPHARHSHQVAPAISLFLSLTLTQRGSGHAGAHVCVESEIGEVGSSLVSTMLMLWSVKRRER
jgi:hypothetical protein